MLIDNLKQIRYRIRDAAKRSGRDPDAVTIVAVTKYADINDVAQIINLELLADIGENRVQEAEKKQLLLGAKSPKICWHLIGHLQTNKAKKAVEVFDRVDSIDSEKVAAALNATLADSGRILPVMVQVKMTDRQSQSGVSPDALGPLLTSLGKYPHLQVEGLLSIAPNVEELEDVRPSFRALRELRDRLMPGGKLSMGMSRDFEIAVEEGADMVRIGSQIFSHLSPASVEAPA